MCACNVSCLFFLLLFVSILGSIKFHIVNPMARKRWNAESAFVVVDFLELIFISDFPTIFFFFFISNSLFALFNFYIRKFKKESSFMCFIFIFCFLVLYLCLLLQMILINRIQPQRKKRRKPQEKIYHCESRKRKEKKPNETKRENSKKNVSHYIVHIYLFHMVQPIII